MTDDAKPPFYVGQLLCGGFQGVSVTAQAHHLIVEHHISTMILLRKNAVSVKQMTKLIRDLQHIALTQAHYKYPLIFAVDEEGGMMNSLFDQEFLTQFPGAMALAATGDPDLVYQVLKAIAVELKQIGFLVILGPVLDVITKLSHQLVGVRSFGTTLEEVSRYGKVCAQGLKDGGLITVGKHFPGIGNASVDSLLELPMMADSLDQIRHFNTVPFVQLFQQGLLDGISAAGCGVPTISPDETHACLSPVVINQLLRQELGFKGFVISECLEMDALYHSIGLGQGVILAIYAGCDLVMVCHDLALQNEAVESMQKALANGNLDEETILTCLDRIEVVQKKLPPWDQIFPHSPSASDPISSIVIGDDELFRYKFPKQWEDHRQLSKLAYRKSITLVRDYAGTLPITKYVQLKAKTDGPESLSQGDSTTTTTTTAAAAADDDDSRNILILSPLLNPIYPDKKNKSSESGSRNEDPQLYTGEEVFQTFGELLSNHPSNLLSANPYNVLHTTYTANGLTALHESLIENSRVVIVLTSEASRNMYQIGIVKYVSILCGANPSSFSNGSKGLQLAKPLIIVATLSPYDFFYNKSIGSAYLCCYDYTTNVLEELVGVLMGDYVAEGCIPGEKKFVTRTNKKRKLAQQQSAQQQSQLVHSPKRTQPKRRWLVDEFSLSRDWSSLVKLWKNNASDENDFRLMQSDFQSDNFFRKLYVLLSTTSETQKHFVVRNSSLNILYGIVLTWVDEYQEISLDGEILDDESAAPTTGSIVYILVDKLKRLQSVGKNLHARAVRYLIKEKKCQTLELGTLFPILMFPDKNYMFKGGNRLVTSFMNNVGWDVGASTPTKTKHFMILHDLIGWSVPKKIFRELMIVGVRFDICTHPEKLMTLINKTISQKSRQEEESKYIKQIYMEAVKYLTNQSSYEVKIIIALEPTNQNVIGSIILFTNKSQLSKFFPFVDEANKENAANKSNNLVGGIIAPVIDPLYSNLTEIFKFGLICSGITYLKSLFNEDSSYGIINTCIIGGIDEDKSLNGVKEIGFKEWRQYYEYYDKKSNASSVFLGE